MEKDKLFRYIDSRWPDARSGDLAKSIAECIFLLREQEAECLSYGDLLTMAKCERIDHDFQAALTILTAGKYALLKAYGIFVDDDGEEFPVKDEDFSHLLAENVIVHPQTGVVVEDAAQHVAPVFEKI